MSWLLCFSDCHFPLRGCSEHFHVLFNYGNLIWWKGVHDALSQACIISHVFIPPVCCWLGRGESPTGSLNINLLSPAYVVNKDHRHRRLPYQQYAIKSLWNNWNECVIAWGKVCMFPLRYFQMHHGRGTVTHWPTSEEEILFFPSLDKHTEAVKVLGKGRWCEIRGGRREKMRTIDLCKKSVHLTVLVIMVECARWTGSLTIPQKPDKLSPAWTASIDFYPADETHVLLVIHSVDDRRDKDDAPNQHAAQRLLRWDSFKGVTLQHRGKKSCFTIVDLHRSGGPVVTHVWSS